MRMLLDVGNTGTNIGLFDGDTPWCNKFDLIEPTLSLEGLRLAHDLLLQ